MKNFMLLHYGFTQPSPEIMKAWGEWFETIKDRMVEQGAHFSFGKEIDKSGTTDMPLGEDSITGYTIISASDIEEACEIASKNPFIKSIRVYEMMSNNG